MRLKLKKLKVFFQSLNFVIVPNGANGKVRQFRLPKLLLIVAPLLVIVPTILFYHYFNLSSDQQEEQLKLNTSLVNTESEYEQLREEISELKKEKSDMTFKLEQLEKLELEMREYMTELPEEVGPKGGLEIPLMIDEKKSDFFSRSDQLMDRFEETIVLLEDTKSKISYLPTIMPADSKVVTSAYGSRKDPFTGRTSFHSGIDFRGKIGSPVYATARGVVELAGRNGGYGNTIIIKHDDSYKTLYAHLSEIKVKNNERVEKGDLIGAIGNTGRSTGPHLHYEVLKNNEPVNPNIYIELFK